MKARSLLILITILALLSSCTTNVPYPDTWPKINQNSDSKCLSLEGKYKNSNDNYYFTELLNIEILGPKENVTLELKIEDTETLSITVNQIDEEPKEYELTFAEHDFSCKEGIIRFKRGREYYMHQVVMATSRADVQLFDSENFIVAKLTHKSYTLAMLVLPIKNNNIKWKKWEKIN